MLPPAGEQEDRANALLKMIASRYEKANAREDDYPPRVCEKEPSKEVIQARMDHLFEAENDHR